MKSNADNLNSNGEKSHPFDALLPPRRGDFELFQGAVGRTAYDLQNSASRVASIHELREAADAAARRQLKKLDKESNMEYQSAADDRSESSNRKHEQHKLVADRRDQVDAAYTEETMPFMDRADRAADRHVESTGAIGQQPAVEASMDISPQPSPASQYPISPESVAPTTTDMIKNHENVALEAKARAKLLEINGPPELSTVDATTAIVAEPNILTKEDDFDIPEYLMGYEDVSEPLRRRSEYDEAA